MTNTMQITFRNMESSATAEEWIREEIRKLDEFYSHIMGCRVVVELSNRHHRSGNLYHVRIDLTVPGGELVVKREPSLHSSIRQTQVPRVVKHLELMAPHRELRQAIDDAFKTMGRRLQDYSRRQRQDVKSHEPKSQAHVRKLFPADGFGFLETPGGREVYFHENSVLGEGFARLKIGAAVNFVEESGEKGPQASTVKVAHPRHPRRTEPLAIVRPVASRRARDSR